MNSARDFKLGSVYKCFKTEGRNEPMIIGEAYECVGAIEESGGYAHLKGPIAAGSSTMHVNGDIIEVLGWCTYFELLYDRGACRHEYVPVEFVGTKTVTKNICRLCDMEKK